MILIIITTASVESSVSDPLVQRHFLSVGSMELSPGTLCSVALSVERQSLFMKPFLRAHVPLKTM